MKLPIPLSLVLCILSGIFLSACQQESGTAGTEESVSETDTVLVRVNGEPITDVDLSVTTHTLAGCGLNNTSSPGSREGRALEIPGMHKMACLALLPTAGLLLAFSSLLL